MERTKPLLKTASEKAKRSKAIGQKSVLGEGRGRGGVSGGNPDRDLSDKIRRTPGLLKEGDDPAGAHRRNETRRKTEPRPESVTSSRT